jgi:hypothetical protein
MIRAGWANTAAGDSKITKPIEHLRNRELRMILLLQFRKFRVLLPPPQRPQAPR